MISEPEKSNTRAVLEVSGGRKMRSLREAAGTYASARFSDNPTRHFSKTARVVSSAGCFGNKGLPAGSLFSETARMDMSAGCFGNIRAQDTPGRPKTASHRDSGGAAKARFYTPRSLRKRPSCLKSEARFPVGAVWHPAFAQVGGPPVRPRDFRAGKIKHEGRFRSERGVQNAVSTRGGGHVCLGAVFGQPPAVSGE